MKVFIIIMLFRSDSKKDSAENWCQQSDLSCPLLCSSPQLQHVCAAHVGSLQRKPEQLEEPECNRYKEQPAAPSGEQLYESQQGVPLHPQRPPVDQPEKAARVHRCPWQAERGASCLCAGDQQSVPGRRSAETSGTFTGLIEGHKSSSASSLYELKETVSW